METNLQVQIEGSVCSLCSQAWQTLHLCLCIVREADAKIKGRMVVLKSEIAKILALSCTVWFNIVSSHSDTVNLLSQYYINNTFLSKDYADPKRQNQSDLCTITASLLQR